MIINKLLSNNGVMAVVVHSLLLTLLVIFFVQKDLFNIIGFSFLSSFASFFILSGVKNSVSMMKNSYGRIICLLLAELVSAFTLLFNALILAILVVSYISTGFNFVTVTLISFITILITLILMNLNYKYCEWLSEKKLGQNMYSLSEKDTYFFKKTFEIGTILVTVVLLGNTSFGIAFSLPVGPIPFIFTKEYWQFSMGYTIYSLFLYYFIEDAYKTFKTKLE